MIQQPEPLNNCRSTLHSGASVTEVRGRDKLGARVILLYLRFIFCGEGYSVSFYDFDSNGLIVDPLRVTKPRHVTEYSIFGSSPSREPPIWSDPSSGSTSVLIEAIFLQVPHSDVSDDNGPEKRKVFGVCFIHSEDNLF